MSALLFACERHEKPRPTPSATAAQGLISEASSETPPLATATAPTIQRPYLCSLGTAADFCAECLEPRLAARPGESDSVCLCRPIDVRLPDALVVVDGDATDVGAELIVPTADGRRAVCHYSGADGARLGLDTCELDGATVPAGTVVSADAATLAVDGAAGGGNGKTDAIVAVQLGEAHPDNPTCPAPSEASGANDATAEMPWGFAAPVETHAGVGRGGGKRRAAGRTVVTRLHATSNTGTSTVEAELVDGRGRRLPATRPVTTLWSHTGSSVHKVAVPVPANAVDDGQTVFLDITASATDGTTSSWHLPLDTTPPTQQLQMAFGTDGAMRPVHDGDRLDTDAVAARIEAIVDDDSDRLESFVVRVESPSSPGIAARQQVVKPIVVRTIEAGAAFYPTQVGPLQVVTISTLDRSGNLSLADITINLQTPAADDITAYIEQLRGALCDLDARCGYGMFPAARQTCLDDFTRFGVLEFPESTRDVLRLDWDLGSECLQRLTMVDCDDGLGLLSDDTFFSRTCIDALKGRVPAGRDCYAQIECVDDATCQGIEDGGVCPGTCTTVRRECGVTTCEFDEYCADRSTSTCATVDGLGAPCSGLGADHECEFGLFCLPSSTGFACSPGRQLGQTCEPFEQPCDLDLVCATFVIKTPFCTPPRGDGALGDVCNDAVLMCGHGLYCDLPEDDSSVFGVCQPRLGAGVTCGASTAPCERGLTCLRSDPGVDGTCTEPQPGGAPCLIGNDCASGQCDDGTCLPVGSFGGECVRP